LLKYQLKTRVFDNKRLQKRGFLPFEIKKQAIGMMKNESAVQMQKKAHFSRIKRSLTKIY
jgi:hypothetical protein